MIGFKRILVPTDFSDCAEYATDVAATIALRFEATVRLLHVHAPPIVAYPYAVTLAWPLDDLMAAAERAMARSLARVRERIPEADSVVVEGDPARSILDTVEGSHADLIVMGTHGRRGLSRVLLGSVAEKVVRLSVVPVLTVSDKTAAQARTAHRSGANAG